MITVVIPTYNGLKHLETCFDSLRNQKFESFAEKPEVRVILVDNGSSDGSVEFVTKNYPEVEIIKLDKNYGFAKAVNEGIKYSLESGDTKRILLLNNDIECADNFLEEMLKGFTDDFIGSVACKMMNFYNRDVFDDAGDFIKLIGSPYARGHGEKDTGQYDKPEFIFGACAGAAMYRSEIFGEIEFFDEDFFAYYEDVDFSFRIQIAGYKCFYNPKAICYHKRGATSGYTSGWQTMLCERNLIAMRIKNYPLSLYIKLTPLFFIARLKRYCGFLRAGWYKVFFSAVSGYLKGLARVPSSVIKRRKVQKMKKVDNKYIYSVFTNIK
ncbi:MAG: glycosyltransferase family 2 protein [Ignavibacteriae bacterium]|nr:glycosyltransferase family 2 protein [Ignavibacteriota bacterium]